MVHILGPQLGGAQPIRAVRTHRKGYPHGQAGRLPVCQDSLATLPFASPQQQPGFIASSLQSLGDGITVGPPCCNLLQPSAQQQPDEGEPCAPCIQLARQRVNHSTSEDTGRRHEVSIKGVVHLGPIPQPSLLPAAPQPSPPSDNTICQLTPISIPAPSFTAHHATDGPTHSTLANAHTADSAGHKARSWTSGAAIAADMNKCRSLQQLSDLYSRTGSSWDSTHVVAALCKAAKAAELGHGPYPEAPASALPLLNTLLTSAQDACRRGKHTLRQLVNLLWVVARLQLWKHPAGLQLLATVTTQLHTYLERLPLTLPQQSSSCHQQPAPRHAAGQQQVAPGHAAGQQQVAPGHAAGQQQVATGVQGAATQEPCASQRHHTAQRSQYKAVTSQDIGNSVWALVRLGIQLPHTTSCLNKSAATSSTATATTANHHQLPLGPGPSFNVSSSHLSHLPDDHDDAVLPEVTLPDGLKSQLSQLWPLLLQHVPDCAQHMPAEYASITLWALAHVNTARATHVSDHTTHQVQQQQLCDVAVTALSGRLVQIAGQLRSEHVAQVLWACACLDNRDAVLLSALVDQTHSQLRWMSAKGLSMVSWALGRLNYQCPDLARDLTAAATWRIKRFRMQGLSNFVWGLNIISRGRIARPFLSLVARETLYKLDEAQALTLTTLMTTWSAAGHYNQRLYTTVLSRASQLLPTFLPHTLIKLLVAVHHVRHVDLAFMGEAAKQLQQLTQPPTPATSALSPSSAAAAAAAGSNRLALGYSVAHAVAAARVFEQTQLQQVPSVAAYLTALAPHLHAALNSKALSGTDMVHLALAYSNAGFQVLPISQHAVPFRSKQLATQSTGHQHVANTSARQSADIPSATTAAVQEDHVQRFLHGLSRELEAVHPLLTVAELSQAACALVALGSPAGHRLAAAWLAYATSNQGCWRQVMQEVDSTWRARLAAVLMTGSQATAGLKGHHKGAVQHAVQGTEAAASVAAVVHKLLDSIQEELHTLDAAGLLHVLHAMQLLNASTSHSARATVLDDEGVDQQLAPVVSSGFTAVNDFKLVAQELSDRCSDSPPWESLTLLATMPNSLQPVLSPIITSQASRLVSWAQQFSQPPPQPVAAAHQSSLHRGSHKEGTSGFSWAMAAQSLPASTKLMVLVHAWSALTGLGRADAHASRVLRHAVLALVTAMPPPRDMPAGEAADVALALSTVIQLDAGLQAALQHAQQRAVRA